MNATSIIESTWIEVPWRGATYSIPDIGFRRVMRDLALFEGCITMECPEGAHCQWPRRALSVAAAESVLAAMDEARAKRRLPF